MLMGPVSRYGLVGIVEDASIPHKGSTTADRTKTSPGVYTVLKHKEQIFWLPTWGYWQVTNSLWRLPECVAVQGRCAPLLLGFKSMIVSCVQQSKLCVQIWKIQYQLFKL